MPKRYIPVPSEQNGQDTGVTEFENAIPSHLDGMEIEMTQQRLASVLAISQFEPS